MSNRSERSAREELEACFPGLPRKRAGVRSLMARVLRAVSRDVRMDAADPAVRDLTLETNEIRESNATAAALFGVYWSDPGRMIWTPFLAGTAARLWELAPELFTTDLILPARVLALSTPDDEPMDEVGRMVVAQLAQAVAPILRDRCVEARAVAELGLEPAMSLVDRAEALEGWLAVTERPAAWVAVHLPAVLLLGGPPERMLQAVGPYRRVAKSFAALADRQGARTWDAAVHDALTYWRDPRGSAWLESLARPVAVSAPAQPARGKATLGPRPGAGPDRTLVKKLATRLGRAKREADTARAEGEALRAQISGLTQELAEARRGRDRAAERLRKVEREHGELQQAQAAGTSSPAPVPAEPADGRAVVPFPVPVATAAPVPGPEAVLSGRKVYLYTGLERAAAREALAGSLEHYGARVEVFDGNRQTLLGPERFPADALVIIETSHLCHSNSDRLVARARASGAWHFVGASGSGGLARRVVERWARLERGVG